MKNLFKSFAFAALIGCFATSCSQAPEGQKVETEETKEVNEEAKTASKVLTVDTENSQIEWVGTKTGGQHTGTLAIKSGSLNIKGDEIVGGSFVIDMTSLDVTDIEGEDKEGLIKHLTSGDFFEIEKYAEASFEITKVTAIEGEEGVTHNIEGNLKIKDAEHGVTIPATVELSEGGLNASTAQFTINRQDWGINYKSSMKDVILNNEIGIKITLKAS